MNDMNKPDHRYDQDRPKRIAIYVIFDKDGILDGYRKYYLEKLREVTDRIVTVVNGTLTPESRAELEELTDDFFVRENKGLLAYGWIEGIKHIGWDTLAAYDELLMLNDSFFGPFYPLSELMDAAEESDADFYGAMKNFEDKKIVELNGRGFKHGYLHGSICYFYIIKRRLLHSPEFKKYWGELPAINDAWDTYFFDEFDFYDYVRDAGFKIDAYQGDDLKGYCHDSLSQCMYKLVKDEKIPFARIRPFSSDMLAQALQINYGKDPRNTLEYIDKHTDYNADLIWDYILRTKNLNDIWYQLQMEYVLSSEYVEKPFTYEKRIAVILHIYYIDLVDDMVQYCRNFPENTDFYITTTDRDTEQAINIAFAAEKLHYTCKVRPNVGMAISSLWITYADVVTSGKYEYICYFHDKKSNYWDYTIEGEQFGVRCYENLIGSKELVQNIINLFIDNPRLGMLGAPEPYHGHYFNVRMTTWHINFDNVVELAKKMDIHADIRQDTAPLAPYGDMFWFRSEALKKAVGYGFTYDDFEFEYKPDGTILHAIERLYGLAVQDSGFYYAIVINSDNARSDLVNYQYILYQLCAVIYGSGEDIYSSSNLVDSIWRHYFAAPDGSPAARFIIKNAIKKRIPKPIWSVMKKTYHIFGGTKWVG